MNRASPVQGLYSLSCKPRNINFFSFFLSFSLFPDDNAIHPEGILDPAGAGPQYIHICITESLCYIPGATNVAPTILQFKNMNAYNYVIYKYAFFVETYLSILFTYRGLSGFLLQHPQIIPPPR